MNIKNPIFDLPLKIIIYFTLSIIGIYITCMFAIPVYKYNFDWKKINQLLYDWQTFNAGMIAIIASLIALSTTAYREEKQRGRDLRAAKAFLPHVLSDLCIYCEVNIQSLHNTLVFINGQREVRLTNFKVAQFNENVFNAFSECIRHAEAEDGDFLANIVSDLQVIRSRLNRLENINSKELHIPSSIYGEITKISITRKLIDNCFDYARNLGPIINKEINNEEIRKILLFQCNIHQIDEGLKDYISRRKISSQPISF